MNKVCEGDDFEHLVDAFDYHLPESVDRETVYESVFYLAGERLTKLALWTAAFRLAGNLPRLRAGSTAGPWIVQRDKEWVPAQIVSASRRRGGGFKQPLGWKYTFQILGGTPCPLRITKFWPDKVCYFLKNDLGFNKRSRPPKSGRPLNHLFRNPLEFVNLRMWLLLDPKESESHAPGFKEIGMSGPLKKHNREMMARRDRYLPQYACPKGFGAEVSCHRCPIGMDRCPAAVHAKTYTFEFCLTCSRMKAPFDRFVSTDTCVECLEKQAILITD